MCILDRTRYLENQSPARYLASQSRQGRIIWCILTLENSPPQSTLPVYSGRREETASSRSTPPSVQPAAHHVDSAGVLVGLTSGEGLGNQLDTGKLETLVRQALQVGLAPLENNPHSAVTVQVDQVVNLLVGCAEHLPQRLRIDGFVANHPQINTIQRLAFLLCNLGFPRMLQTQTVSKGKLLLTLS